MIRIGILGDIGSGKSYVAKCFGYPVCNADYEVSKLYKKNRKVFYKLKKIFPKHFNQFPINKSEVSKAILEKNKNLEKIVKIVHKEIRKKMLVFIKKNNDKKVVIFDIPLLLENKINNKRDILIFVQSKKAEIIKRLKRRKGYNPKLLSKFRKIQLPLDYKKKKSQFIIKNDFKKNTVMREVNVILKAISK